MPEIKNLRQEEIILAYGFRGFSSWLFCSIVSETVVR
jgi:hypothetical protein